VRMRPDRQIVTVSTPTGGRACSEYRKLSTERLHFGERDRMSMYTAFKTASSRAAASPGNGQFMDLGVQSASSGSRSCIGHPPRTRCTTDTIDFDTC